MATTIQRQPSKAQEQEVLSELTAVANVNTAVSVKAVKRMLKQLDESLAGDSAARAVVQDVWKEFRAMSKNTTMLSALTVGAIIGEKAAVQQLRELADDIRYQNVRNPLVAALFRSAHGDDEYERQSEAYDGTTTYALHKLQRFLQDECGMTENAAFGCGRYFILGDDTRFHPSKDERLALGEWLGEIWERSK